jgi:hypothetical protein
MSNLSINLNIQNLSEYKNLLRNYNDKNVNNLIQKILDTIFAKDKIIKKNIDIFKERYINKLIEIQNEIKNELDVSHLSKSKLNSFLITNLPSIYEDDDEATIFS